VMSEAGWNIQEMENEIFEGAEAAVATIRFDGIVTDEVVRHIDALDTVLAVSVIDL